MKPRKVYWILFVVSLILIFFLMYIFKPMTMNDIYTKPNFKGTVVEVMDNSILVSVNENEEEFKSLSLIHIFMARNLMNK